MAKFFRKTGVPVSDASVWTSKSNAGQLIQKEFFGIPFAEFAGQMQYWNGTDWVYKPVKFWSGDAWYRKPVRYWDGAFWLKTQQGYGPNYFTKSLDLFSWSGATGNNATLSRDTVTPKSPSNGIPLAMQVTGADPYTITYGAATWNISRATNLERWVAKVWVKASVNTTGQIFIFGTDPLGGFISTTGAFQNTDFFISQAWTEVTASITFPKQSSLPNLANVQVRLDGPNALGTGITIWWDDLRVYRID